MGRGGGAVRAEAGGGGGRGDLQFVVGARLLGEAEAIGRRGAHVGLELTEDDPAGLVLVDCATWTRIGVCCKERVGAGGGVVAKM